MQTGLPLSSDSNPSGHVQAESVSSFPEAAKAGVRRVQAVVVGAGPVGQLCYEQLQGLEFVHSECCQRPWHSMVAPAESVYINPIPVRAGISDRGKYDCGNWFDSFSFNVEGDPQCCLESRCNSKRKGDTLLIADSEPGGSWTSYHPQQKTISPLTWMGFPHRPISDWYRQARPQWKADNPRERIEAQSLCQYYQSGFISDHSVLLNHHVHKVTRQADGEWVLDVSGKSGVSKGSVSISGDGLRENNTKYPEYSRREKLQCWSIPPVQLLKLWNGPFCLCVFCWSVKVYRLRM